MAAVSTTEQVTTMVAQAGGLAILAGTLAAIVAFLYRWSLRETVSSGLAMLVGLSAVAIYLNTTSTLAGVVSGGPTNVEEALFNIAAFAVAGGGAVVGRRVGDRFGSEVFVDGGVDAKKDVGQFVRSVGRVVAIDLPEDIDDVVGYDPVPEQTKEALAGRRFLFPRKLTVEELHDRLVTRLKTDYGVGHVDVELAANGRVDHLAVGSRAAGIGPTLPPATNAVAIRADPAHAASAGDLVQVWETGPMRRVLTAELRGVADDTVTIAIDAADTPKLDPREEYRLVTLPVTDRPDREFASLLRAAEKTFSSVTVVAGSPLHGMPVGSLDLAVVSVQPESGDPVTLPNTSHVLAPGDAVFVVARPTELRRLQTAAEPLDPSLVRDIGKPRMPSEQSGPPAEGPSGPESPEAGEPTRPGEAPQGEKPGEKRAEPAEPATTPATLSGAGEESAEGAEADAGDGTAEPDAGEVATPAAEEADDDSEPAETDAADTSEESGDGDEGGIGSKAGTGSFAQLKDEFESGEAEWAESEAESPDDGVSDEAAAEATETASTEDLTDLSMGDDDDSESGQASGDGVDESRADDGLAEFGGENELDELGIAEESEADTEIGGLEAEDELEDLGVEEGEDDYLSGLSFDEEEDIDDLTFEGDDEAETEAGDATEGDDEDDDDEDDDDDDGGGSFAQLKEEFESGEADWADDIGSPGGDMRLDE